MGTDNLETMSSVDLQKELAAVSREKFGLRIQKATGQLVKTNLLRETKKKVARIKTILRMRQISEGISHE